MIRVILCVCVVYLSTLMIKDQEKNPKNQYCFFIRPLRSPHRGKNVTSCEINSQPSSFLYLEHEHPSSWPRKYL
ncbi:hypothetical protein C5167_049332 [Papaver somniferum]|uniref:Secreted protein n=1 Tax=Papaver somniferum TaxID=3469 RepID=A0A4Y7KLY9_PAPSO|nr:hypothetical protein C5167_049332 [Papaver somniferum]